MSTSAHLSSLSAGAIRAAGVGLIFTLIVSLGTTVLAQTAARPDRGLRPVGSYSVSDIESISLTNGNLNLSIPLAALPPMPGGKLSWALRAVYNSKLWDVTRTEVNAGLSRYVVDNLQQSELSGWRFSVGYSLRFRDAREDFDWADPQAGDPDAHLLTSRWVKLVLTTPDGAEHELRPLDFQPFGGTRDHLKGYYKDTPDTVAAPVRYYSFDSSYLWAVVNPATHPSGIRWEVYLPDGTRIYQRNNGVQKVEDTNGNKIKISTSVDAATATTTTHIEDELTGREVRFTRQGMSGQAQYQTVGGAWVTIDVVFGTTTVKGKTYPVQDEGCTRTELMPTTAVEVVREIILPQSELNQPRRRFLFSYNSDVVDNTSHQWQAGCNGLPLTVSQASRGMGSLSRMVTPAGAAVSYSYQMDSLHALLAADEASRESISAKVLDHDSTSDRWEYNITSFGGSVSGPDGATTTETFYSQDKAAPGYYAGITGKGGLVYRTRRSDKQVVERRWRLMKFDSASDSATNGRVSFNPVVEADFTTLLDTTGQAVKMRASKYEYDFNGNLTKQTDYDWFSPGLVSRDSEGVPQAVPTSAAVLRVINHSYYNAATASSSTNVYAKRATAATSPLITNAVKETTVGSARTRYSYDGQAFGSAPVKGNLTTESRWDDRAGKDLHTTHTYDLLGNRSSTTDPRNNLTQYFYEDSTQAQPTRVVVDPLNGTGQQTTLIGYDFSTGAVLSQTDPNGNVTSTDYVNHLTGSIDPYGRPATVTGPLVTSVIDGVEHANQRRKVVTKYFDTARQVEVISDLSTAGDGLLRSRTTSDQLGRVVLSEASEGGSTYTISSQTVYERMGRIVYTSNARRAEAATTDGWSRTSRDELGRVVEVATFSGVAMPPPIGTSGTNAGWTGSVVTTYNADQTVVRDQAGKHRRSYVDGLGRLVKIEEMSDAVTVYAATEYRYDQLGNLTEVNQGAQQRRYVYDSVSRLREAFNPEQVNSSGVNVANRYEYDDASNLKGRTNPNGSSVSYSYDGLNRVATKTLSTGGVWVYGYDTGENCKGRLVSVVRQGTSEGTYYDGYDALGRVSASRQVTDGTAYQMSYGYDLAGNVTSQFYPSGKEVRSSYDAAGRLTAVSRYTSGAQDRSYVTVASYTAQGAVSQMILGNGLRETTTYNSRLQAQKMELRRVSSGELLLGLEYGYGGAANNGNIISQTIRIGTTQISQSYTYDALNRLKSATEAGAWTQTYEYDRYGNRAVAAGYVADVALTPQSIAAFDANTNRLMGSEYDESGNQVQDQAARSFGYDAENRQVSFNSGAATYSYDADGRRVKNVDGTGTTIFVYNALGQLIAEYSTASPQGSGGTSYLTSDHLGSTRVVTDTSGNVRARHDYLPFGEEVASKIGGRSSVPGYGGVDSTRQKFTSKERDTESGLDYFGARYYSSAQGRFTSCDPMPVTKESFVNPQRWNLYIYVNNNPLVTADPNGADGDGKGGDKVISIFLEFGDNERNYMTHSGGKRIYDQPPNWAQTAILGAFAGYRVDFFGRASTGLKGLPMLGSSVDFENAHNSSEVVVYIGHGRGHNIGGPDTPFAQNSIQIDPLHIYGQVGVFTDPLPMASDPNISEYMIWGEPPTSSVGVFCSFTCGSADAPNYFRSSSGQIQVVVNGGRLNETAVGTLERAAKAFIDVYLSTKGTTEERVAAGVAAANKVIDESRIPVDQDGDKVRSKKVGN